MTPLGFGKIRRRSALLLLLIALLFIGVVVIAARAVLKARVSAHETDLIVTVVSFPRDAKVTRAGQVLANVLPGTRLRRNDVLFGGTKGNFDLYIGSLAIVRVKPGTNVLLQTLLQRSNGDLDVGVKINTGRVLTRLRRLTGQSQFHMNAPGAVTAARGTAYMVQGTKSRTSVLVAEGRVGVQLPAGGRELLLSPRRKVTFTTTLPAASVPTTPADEPVIRELLGLRLPPAGGPAAGTTLSGLAQGGWSGVDPAEIVVASVLNLRPDGRPTGLYGPLEFIGVAPYTVTYSPRWRIPGRRAVILSSARPKPAGFLTVERTGLRRSLAKGMFFEFTSLDGNTIYMTRPSGGLYAMNFDGTNLRRITSRPVNRCSLSPDGKHILAYVGWSYDRQYNRSLPTLGSLVVMRVDGSGFRTIARTSKYLYEGQSYRWRQTQAMDAVWTTNGNIVLHRGMDILRLNHDGEVLQRLARDAKPDRAQISASGEWILFEGGWAQIKPGVLANRKSVLFAMNTATGKRTTLPSSYEYASLEWIADNLAEIRVVNEQVNAGQRRLRSGLPVLIMKARTYYTLTDPRNIRKRWPLFEKENRWADWRVSPDQKMIAFEDAKSRRLGFADAVDPRTFNLTRVRLPEFAQLDWISGGRELSFSTANKKVILSLAARPSSAPVKQLRVLQRAASPLVDFATKTWITALISVVLLAVALAILVCLGIGILRLLRTVGEVVSNLIRRSREDAE